MERTFVFLGAALGLLGVALGAFGAHGLSGRVPPGDLEIFETAVRYHMYHVLALFAVAAVSIRWPGTLPALSGWFFVGGIAIFSGSLYVLVLTGMRWLGAVTPIGGVSFLVGWALLAVAALRG